MLTTNYLLRYRLLPHKEDPNNEVAEEAKTKTASTAAHLTFLQKINFCPFFA